VIDHVVAVFGAGRKGVVSPRDIVVTSGISLSEAREHLAVLVGAGVLTTARRRLPGTRWDRIGRLTLGAARGDRRSRNLNSAAPAASGWKERGAALGGAALTELGAPPT
jgi:hypothetical protein